MNLCEAILRSSNLQRLRVDPVNNTVHVCCQSAAPDSAVTDLGKVDGTFAGRVALPGTAPAGQTDLLAGVQVGEVAEQAHVLAPGAVIKAQAEIPAFSGRWYCCRLAFMRSS